MEGEERPRPRLGGPSDANLVRLVYAGLVVLVLGVEARLEVVDERGGRRQQRAHHAAAAQQQLRGGGRRAGRRAGGRRGGRAAPARARAPPPAPLRDLSLDVQRAPLGPATVTTRLLRAPGAPGAPRGP